MKFRHWIEYGFALGFCKLLCLLPRAVALELGAALGSLAWLLGIRKNLILQNLQRVFPSLSAAERQRLAFASVRNFGRTVAEYGRLNGNDQNRIGDFVEVEGGEKLQTALQAGRGALVVTGHLGSWALYMGALQEIDISPALLVGRHHNVKFDQLILNIPGRNVQFISKGPTAPRHVLKCLKENRAVVMVADQHSSMGLASPFLGHPAMTLALPGAIIAKHQVPLFLLDGYRVEGGRHKMVISEIEIPEGLEGDELRQAVTDRCNEAIGGTVLRHPEQYFWYHKRWRI